MSKVTPEARLKKLRKLEANSVCPNCGTRAQPGIGFGNVCVKFNTFVCDHCKTSHQAISHRVKSITMSNWTSEEVDALCTEHGGGNEAALHIWLQNAPAFGQKYRGGSRPREGDKIEVFKKFVVDCYEHGMFRATTPFVPAAASSVGAASTGPTGTASSAPRKSSDNATTIGRISPVPSSRPAPSTDPFGNTSPFGSSLSLAPQAPTAATSDLLFDAFDDAPAQAAHVQAAPFAFGSGDPFSSSTHPPAPASAAPSSGFDFIATGAADPFAGAGGQAASSGFDAFSSHAQNAGSASAGASPHPSTSGFDFISNSASSPAQPSAFASQQNSAFASSNDLFGLSAFAADGSRSTNTAANVPQSAAPSFSAPTSDPFGSVFLQPAPLLTPTSSASAPFSASTAPVAPVAADTGTGLTAGTLFHQPPQQQYQQHHQMYPPQPAGPGHLPTMQQQAGGASTGMPMNTGMGMGGNTGMRTTGMAPSAPSPSAMGGGYGMGMGMGAGMGVAQAGYRADPIGDAFSGLGLPGPSGSAPGRAGFGAGAAAGAGAGARTGAASSFDFVQSNMRQQLGGLPQTPLSQHQQQRIMGQGQGATLGQLQQQQQQQGFSAMRPPPQPMNMGMGLGGGFSSGNPQFPYR